jgi:hydroxymethylglutaryl-CoA reductase
MLRTRGKRVIAFIFAQRHDNGDYYYSVTIPSLIVATYGGGTRLATQRECLEMLGCYGAGKVRKFAEIVAATVPCGELSLGSAVVAEEWVEAHDLCGRNRPYGRRPGEGTCRDALGKDYDIWAGQSPLGGKPEVTG